MADYGLNLNQTGSDRMRGEAEDAEPQIVHSAEEQGKKVVVFGLEERRDKCYFGKLEVVNNFL
jgi:hypothetical protein